ncbi:Phosphatidyl serine synthase domain-containing protein [Rozella allomycis CSF55]|uniref:Phosphatidyl serine synthase domain-containing protein n=1 Tax=Rozella allomycis (strain CSF55) TaxID=988480 RepID=A0A075AMU7_ROZAC|nr:Phosphatidyl serine synthase domain-containing protein [Rozella allomycis CSF55]|eukprot:EPZ30998.1 Phosphatidyl serine synthase domain-containing protein [Rozella allomycis CSF55]
MFKRLKSKKKNEDTPSQEMDTKNTPLQISFNYDDFYRDQIVPTLHFLYQPHTLTVLLVMLLAFLYVAVYRSSVDPVDNIKTGLVASSIVLVFIGSLHLPNGPFIRPHPAFWRFVMALNVVYQLFLVFLLFQDKHHSRAWLGYIDSSLGVRLPERSYAEFCDFTYVNIKSQMDIFVVAHALGWFAKALIIRDYWFCWILSIMFELMEYSLQHHLPNFAECWWDHV